ncbi:MAG: YHS domain-containing (seleno)protein [Hyphomicrobiales bacterium]|nr:YHS domain-containing (seleno)protein [Hyphomicrobiales bacterium]
MTIKKHLGLGLAAVLFATLTPMSAAFAVDEHYAKDGVAIDGYDTVAFFTAGKPVQGSTEFSADYQGVKWNFSSAANRDLFAADPAKYAPAYGGWCSAGASKGKKVPVKAEFWAIVDGQLYLNSSDAAHNKLFLGDTKTVISKGEGNWKRIFATPASKL